MAAESAVRSIAEVAADLEGVLAGFRSGRTFPFSFGDGTPEAVLLTYDQFEDLEGESKFERFAKVLAPQVMAAELVRMVEAIRSGSFAPVAFGDGGEPEAVVMSVAQYRELRGDDQPPPGVPDDPTQRTYASEPLPTSKPFDLDEWAADSPFTQKILEELRAEEGLPPRDQQQ